MVQNSTQPSPTQSSKSRWIAAAVGGAILIALLIAAAWWVIGGANAFGPRTVGDLLSSSPSISPVEETSTLCAEPGCVEGWHTDVGSYLRFESAGEAEYWATVLGDDGRRFGTIVLDMRDTDLSFEQRRQAIDVLFATHDWH